MKITIFSEKRITTNNNRMTGSYSFTSKLSLLNFVALGLFFFYFDFDFEPVSLRLPQKISIGNTMLCSDIWHKYHE